MQLMTLIYIIGRGSSGSTLLAQILGSHSRIFCAGELWQLPSYAKQDKICSCGNVFSKCEVWGRIMENAGIDEKLDDLVSPLRMKHLVLTTKFIFPYRR